MLKYIAGADIEAGQIVSLDDDGKIRPSPAGAPPFFTANRSIREGEVVQLIQMGDGTFEHIPKEPSMAVTLVQELLEGRALTVNALGVVSRTVQYIVHSAAGPRRLKATSRHIEPGDKLSVVQEGNRFMLHVLKPVRAAEGPLVVQLLDANEPDADMPVVFIEDEGGLRAASDTDDATMVWIEVGPPVSDTPVVREGTP